MNICYLITTMGHGKGGHFHSLRDTVKALNSVESAFVINIGAARSPVFENASFNVEFIKFKGWNFISVIYNILRLLNKNKVDLLHAFDTRAYFFVRVCSFLSGLPNVMTKCGGPNPKSYFPKVTNLIVYSYENLHFFQKSSRYSKTKIHLIPNRIYEIAKARKETETLKELVKENFLFLRIARIGNEYSKSIIQAMTLVNKLNEDGFSVALAIVGVVENKDVFEQLERNRAPFHYFFTEHQWTSNASCLIGAADAVIGTGRGLMEAAANTKILLTPLNDEDIPCLLNSDNIDDLAASNFSPRNHLKNFSAIDNYEAIKEIFRDSKAKQIHEEFVYNLYKNQFDIRSVINKYQVLYSDLSKSCSYSVFDTLIHAYSVNREFNNKNK